FRRETRFAPGRVEFAMKVKAGRQRDAKRTAGTNVYISDVAFRRELALRGLSQADFAVKANVSPTTLTAIINGRPVAARVARKIAIAMEREPVSSMLSTLIAEQAA